ncbi:class I SAM-dependent DNA methyltransferase [Ornatilinea apprima]|uniref:class I SAM-dependent DNA methyltransferase n=1 Tax=Ornatilinea apprima TaxID=1134406 RepID=UPI0009466473|nr:class I SAM-dependent methyltransferase [Ornatilinea apprima]
MDYRLSHLSSGKGASYENSFHKNISRKYIWDWEKEILIKIVNKYFTDRPENYLDFACGTGRIIEHLSPFALNALGVDISDSMLDVAKSKKNLKNVKFIKADITEKNIIGDVRFDLITAFRFFLNAQVSLKKEAIAKLSMLLSDNGILVFNIHMNRTSFLAIVTRIYQLVRNIEKSNMMSFSEVNNLVQFAGLEIVDTYHYGVIPIVRENSLLPYRLIDKIERLFSSIPIARIFSQNIIYVCKKKENL